MALRSNFKTWIKSASSCQQIIYIINKIIHSCLEIRNFSCLAQLDVELKTRREIPYLCASMYHSSYKTTEIMHALLLLRKITAYFTVKLMPRSLAIMRPVMNLKKRWSTYRIPRPLLYSWSCILWRMRHLFICKLEDGYSEVYIVRSMLDCTFWWNSLRLLIIQIYVSVLSVTVLTLWVAPPEMFCYWYRI